MRRIGRVIALVFMSSGCLANVAAAACDASTNASRMLGPQASPVTVILRTRPMDITVGQSFIAEVSVCADGQMPVERIAVDATMPKHRHGMNYVPKLKRVGPGEFEAHGLFFHMPGLWRIEVAVYGRSDPVRLTHDLIVE